MAKVSADDMIDVGGKSVQRFHPLSKKIRDRIPRCISCGQIDEDGYHEAKWCPGMGGDWPFDTSTITVTLKSDTGYRAEIKGRITLTQWSLINRLIEADDCCKRNIVDQHGETVGTASTPITDMLRVEAFVDDKGTAWTPPTAAAYHAVCQALNRRDTRVVALIDALKQIELMASNHGGWFETDAWKWGQDMGKLASDALSARPIPTDGDTL